MRKAAHINGHTHGKKPHPQRRQPNPPKTLVYRNPKCANLCATPNIENPKTADTNSLPVTSKPVTLCTYTCQRKSTVNLHRLSKCKKPNTHLELSQSIFHNPHPETRSSVNTYNVRFKTKVPQSTKKNTLPTKPLAINQKILPTNNPLPKPSPQIWKQQAPLDTINNIMHTPTGSTLP